MKKHGRICLHCLLAALLFVLFVSSAFSATILDDAVWFEREVGQGIVWRYYQFDNLFSAKQSVSYAEVDLSHTSVTLSLKYRDSWVGPAPALDSPDYPRALTSVMAPEMPNAKIAVNGTYFNTASYDPANPTVPWGGGNTYLKVDGTVIHTFDGTNVNRYTMGILFNNTSDLAIALKPGSGGWAGIESSWANMMICGPILLNGGVVETYAPDNDHANARHPRTAVGITATNKLILLTADGRTDDAAGMSCTELANVMLALGCVNAINLDGGGSTTLWAAGEPYNGIVNYPSDNAAYDHLGERRCANVLVAASDAPTPVEWDGRLTNLTYPSLTRSNQIVEVTATYTNIGTETWTTSNVKIAPSRSFGRVSAFIPAGQEDTFFTMTPSSVATGETATFTLNLTAPLVAADTNYIENFVLWHTTEGWFGPADNELRVRVNVRPPLAGPAMFLIQGTATGPNNQWYFEGPSGWGVSTVSFTAEGVSNGGTQRYCGTSTLNRYVRFQPIFDYAGTYRVDIAFPASTNNITQVQYKVKHLEGESTFNINQYNSSLANIWNTLGEFKFGTEFTSEADLGVYWVEVSNPVTTPTGNRFYSGAVRFDYTGPLSGVENWVLY